MTSPLLTGLAVPTVRIPGGFFAVRNPYDTAFGDILLAVLTPVGSRPFNRTFGCRLNQCLFTDVLPQDPATVDYIVRSSVARSCPNLNVVSTSVTRNGLESSLLSITFSIVGDVLPQTRAATVSQSDIFKLVS